MPRPSSTVWDHFVLLCESDRRKHVICSYCSAHYKHAMANKLKQHLLKCNKCPNNVKNIYKQNNVPTNRNSTPEAAVFAPASTSSIIAPSSSPTTPWLSPSSIESSSAISLPSSSSTFNSDASINTQFTARPVGHDDINTAPARAIYASGQPLSLLESEHCKRLFSLFAPSDTDPSRYVLSNTLLDLEYKRLKDAIDVRLTKSLAFALITDGWTNMIGKGVINFIVTTPQPIFYHAIYPEVQSQTGELVSSQIIKIINEIGPSKFVLLVTDNATNMKAAWRIIKREFPHISCVGCLSHSLNLIYKEVFEKIGFFNETLDKVLMVIKFIKHTHVALAQFEKYQAEKFGAAACTLKLFFKTRWSGAHITLNSYKQNREALEQMSISHNIVVPKEIKAIILDTEIWLKVNEITSILDPLATGLLSSEKDTSLLSDAPFIFKKVCQNTLLKLEESVFLNTENKEILIACITSREKKSLQAIHFAAHVLDPRYCGGNMLSDEEVSHATEFIREYCATNGIDEAETLSNMAEFYTKSNFFESSKAIWAPAKQLEPRLWWQTFASKQSASIIAAKILSVPPSSVGAQRNFCFFSRTHTKIRNRLKQPRVLKLISIRANINIFDSQCDKRNGSEVEGGSDRSEDDYDAADSDPQSDIKLSDALYLLDDNMDPLA